ncbi:MAG: Flp pilus assembly complex ATPase component TadA [Verrucomicrobia bacterium]|nr:Flp pilus assembly complex ATPase component TadA [Verrucomicrobiota bacterium]MBU1736458.1 Flp pilus assembly complex ATPase component TadA [Verrucomicrobiota bacterium]MBU1857225.1 Flp pilus assembly complex ATPase component TadA [Verrucomicrobiota bacterium]
MSALLQLEIHRLGHGAQTHAIEHGIYPTGAEQGNKIIIPDSDVEPRHAILIFRPDGFYVEDLNSKAGTFLNEAPVRGRAAFRAGDIIRVGNCRLILRLLDQAAPPPAIAAFPPLPVNLTPSPHDVLDQQLHTEKSLIKKQIHTELLERLDIKRLTAAHIKKADLHERTLQAIEQIVQEVRERLPAWIDPAALTKEIFDESVGLGPLEDLLADPDVTEIMVNRNDQVYVEKRGKLEMSDRVFMDDSSVLAIIERIVAPIGRRIDESQPYVDARLKDGSRVNAIIPPLALNGPCLTIRKFSKNVLTMPELIQLGTLAPEMADFLRLCVQLRKNIVVSGGTGSGKTTFLNVMGSFLPETDRIVTIEDSAELRLPQAHVVRLESRPPNMEGRGAVTIRDLLRNALRMRPDRIVIGECRGGESLDMLQAMNTGHDGSLTTAHANSPRDVIARLETMTLMSGVELPSRAIREQIASAIHMVVQTARMSDGTRKVTHITEISGLEGDRITMQDLFTFTQTGLDQNGKVIGRFEATGSVPTFIEEIKIRGLSLAMSIFDTRKWKH